MTRGDCKAYFARAMYAPREVALLDEETDWIARHVERLKDLQAHEEFSPAIARLRAYGKRITAKRRAAIKRYEKAAAMIDRIRDVRGREILRMRYLQRKTWEQIGEALCYDVRYCSRLHNKALDMIAEP